MGLLDSPYVRESTLKTLKTGGTQKTHNAEVAQFAASAVWSRGESTLRKCAER